VRRVKQPLPGCQEAALFFFCGIKWRVHGFNEDCWHFFRAGARRSRAGSTKKDGSLLIGTDLAIFSWWKNIESGEWWEQGL